MFTHGKFQMFEATMSALSNMSHAVFSILMWQITQYLSFANL